MGGMTCIGSRFFESAKRDLKRKTLAVADRWNRNLEDFTQASKP